MTIASVVDERGYIVKIGDKAPDFEINKTDGTKVQLSDYLGKTVMLQFTASWCSVCRREMPVIEKEVWIPFKDSDFILLGIDREEPAEIVIDFAKNMGVTYPLTLDLKADVFGLYADKKSGVTRNVIIDKEGNIAFLTRLFNRKEFDEMKKAIENLLNK